MFLAQALHKLSYILSSWQWMCTFKQIKNVISYKNIETPKPFVPKRCPMLYSFNIECNVLKPTCFALVLDKMSCFISIIMLSKNAHYGSAFYNCRAVNRIRECGWL